MSQPDEVKEVREVFRSITTERDLAHLLGVKHSMYTYFMYGIKREDQYKIFTINKKSGGKRTITAPVTGLKKIQRSMADILQKIIWIKPSVYGFTKDRNIVQHAKIHSHRKYVFSCDIEDFFPSIHFGRIIGLLTSKPYELNSNIAKAIAQMTTFKSILPQGAPTSPIISNMISSHMDSELQNLAKENKCFYSRYADDITFSTNTSFFPEEICKKESEIIIGTKLCKIIEKHGFKLKESKNRLHPRNEMQCVTGLTVNEFPNVKRRFVRQIRAMLHAWEKYGLELCQKEFDEKYSKNKNRKHGKALFKKVLFGKINFIKDVRGNTNEIYLKFISKYYELSRGFSPSSIYIRKQDIINPKDIVVKTEGKTDWMHLKAALRSLKNAGLYKDLNIHFFDTLLAEHYGNGTLKNFCENARYGDRRKTRTVCIFDRDEEKYLGKMSGKHHEFNYWGNNTYSFPIPCPSHRNDNDDAVSTEMYYSDQEIKTSDKNGRRLFLSTEFDNTTKTHKEYNNIKCELKNISNKKAIIGEKIILYKEDSSKDSIALSKFKFARNILIRKEGFDSFDFSQFIEIFEIINRINKYTPPK
jgi:RNA-directed DNA polymerase